MPDRYRTTVSAVYWTADPDASEEISNTLTDALPEADRDATLVTVEYVKAGRPVTASGSGDVAVSDGTGAT